jgi:hypothetical protein
MKIAEASRQTGLGPQSLHVLLSTGVLVRNGLGIQESSLVSLQEGEHYVTCLECGKRFLQLFNHFPSCGLTGEDYLVKYPNAKTMSSLVATRKAKTQEQRLAQSEKLKARFQTPEGDV